MRKNEKFAQKAKDLLPTLIEKEIKAKGCVEVTPGLNHTANVVAAADYKTYLMKKGDKIILDFGNHQVGYFSMKLGFEGSHPDAPVWMRLHFAEQAVELFESVEDYNGWLSSSWIEEEQIHVDLVPSLVTLPRRYAFRYVEIEILDISSKFALKIEDASCRAVSSADYQKLKPYKTSNPLHEKLDQVACRTLANCMQTVFEDGPKRDRRLWMGDLRLQALANYETFENLDMVKACLYLFAGLPQDNGQVGACVFIEPDFEVDDTSMFDYSLLYVNTLLDYYEASKDMETLKELWPTALTQIDIAKSKLESNGVVKDSDVLGWCFVDWNLELNKQASAQGIFLYSLQAAISIAKILEDNNEVNNLQDLYDFVKEAANKVLWDEDKNCYISGEIRQVSLASQVWLVLGGAIEGDSAVELLNRVEHLEESLTIVTPYMYHNYIDAQLKAGNFGAMQEKLEKYWGGMLEQGADTFWELYNPENPFESAYGGTIVNSYCHAWSCAPAYFLRKYF